MGAYSIRRKAMLVAMLILCAWFLIPVVLSCSGNEGGNAPANERACAPGATQECYCAVGIKGIQICSDDGSRWGECESCQSLTDAGSDAGAKSQPKK